MWPEHFMDSPHMKMQGHVPSFWRAKTPKLDGTTAGGREHAEESWIGDKNEKDV